MRGGQNPPKNCPICEGVIWSGGGPLDTGTWGRYVSHLYTYHPEFKNWSRKISWTYYLALIPFFGLVALSTQIASQDAARLLTVVAVVSALGVICFVWRLKERGTRKFRQVWNEQRFTDKSLA